MPGDKEGFGELAAGRGWEHGPFPVIWAGRLRPSDAPTSTGAAGIFASSDLGLLQAKDRHDLSFCLQAGPYRPPYAQPQRLEEGASSPSSAATGNAEPGGQGPAGSSSRGGQAAQRCGLHHAGARRRAGEGGRALEGGGRGQALPVYVTTRPPRKGKGLESSLLLGRLQQATDCDS